MKLANFKTAVILSITICACIISLNCSFLSNEVQDMSKSNTNIMSQHSHFKDFVAEAHGHMTPGQGACANPSQCRSLNEQLYIAFLRSKAIQTELNLDKIYIAAVQPREDLNGVTKVLMSAPSMLGVGSNDVKGAPLFRICIPTDKSKRSYADYHCPMIDCPMTLGEALSCLDDPSVPLETPLKK